MLGTLDWKPWQLNENRMMAIIFFVVIHSYVSMIFKNKCSRRLQMASDLWLILSPLERVAWCATMFSFTPGIRLHEPLPRHQLFSDHPGIWWAFLERPPPFCAAVTATRSALSLECSLVLSKVERSIAAAEFNWTMAAHLECFLNREIY